MHLHLDFVSTVLFYEFLVYSFLDKSIFQFFAWQKNQIPYQCPINNFITENQTWKEIFLSLYGHTHTNTHNFCHTEVCLNMLCLHMLFYTAARDRKGSFHSASKSENKHAYYPSSLNTYSLYFSFVVQIWPLQWTPYLFE